MSQSQKVPVIPAGQPFYLDIENVAQPTTWVAVFEAVERIKNYYRALSRRYLEREFLAENLMCAMLMREHVMIHGPSGAAKTSLVKTLYKGIVGATVWKMNLTKGTTENQLFGSFDIRKIRESGQYIHMTEGSLAEANFILLGEFFDANDNTLRALLGALNEREVEKGPQVMRIPLYTAIADTNFDPDSLKDHRRELLDAVIDRFLFRVGVEYLKDPRNILAMLDLHLNRVHHEQMPPVTLEDFTIASGVKQGMNLVTDRYVLQAYEELTRRYSELRVSEGGSPVSDRRKATGCEIMEIAALRQGRHVVTFEDLGKAAFFLAHTDEQRQMFEDIKKKVVPTWIKKATQRELEAEMHRLAEIVDKVSATPDTESMKVVELQHLMQQVDEVITELEGFTTEEIEVGRKSIVHMKDMIRLRDIIALGTIAKLLEELPEIPQDLSDPMLLPLSRQVNGIIEQLRNVPALSSDSVMVRRQEALEKAFLARETLQTAFNASGDSIPSEDTSEEI